jgi:hypothetical protein
MLLRAVTKPEAPTDWTDIDEGWDDPVSPSESAPPDEGLASSTSTAPAEIAAPPSRARPKPKTKSKEERAAKAERKAVKQAERRAERRARAQNQKRPAPRRPATAAPPAEARSRNKIETALAPGAELAARASTILSTPRGRVILTIAACLLLLAGLVWFLGFRNGGTLSVG